MALITTYDISTSATVPQHNEIIAIKLTFPIIVTVSIPITLNDSINATSLKPKMAPTEPIIIIGTIPVSYTHLSRCFTIL